MSKNLTLVLCLLAIGSLAFAQSQSQTDVRKRIVGTWKLVSADETLKDGSKRPNPHLGPHGKAFLMYTADGYMCAELMNPDRPAWKDKKTPTNDEKVSSFDGFFGYCGRYEIDAAKHILVHLPEVSLTQDYLGTRQIRPYRFEGNRMILGDKVADDPEIVAWQIMWEKVQ